MRVNLKKDSTPNVDRTAPTRVEGPSAGCLTVAVRKKCWTDKMVHSELDSKHVLLQYIVRHKGRLKCMRLYQKISWRFVSNLACIAVTNSSLFNLDFVIYRSIVTVESVSLNCICLLRKFSVSKLVAQVWFVSKCLPVPYCPWELLQELRNHASILTGKTIRIN